MWGGVAAALAMAAYLATGTVLIGPAPADVGAPPADLGGESLTFPSASGARLAAWSIPGACSCGSIVLLHGVRANRSHLENRARLFREAGYAVLAVDLQAHGESEGEHITFGHLERLDAQAAVAVARDRFSGQPVAVVGVSLGGAAAALAGPDLGADAVVLEAVYADIASATRNRLGRRLGRAGALLAPAFLAQLPLRTGVRAQDLAPRRTVGALGAPVLIVAGTDDAHTTPADTRRLYEAAAPPKSLGWVQGAQHVDFLDYAPESYRERVLGFLRQTLPRAIPPDGQRTRNRLTTVLP